MKDRGNINQVASIAESKSRLIEGTVIKVWPQTRTAQVRLDGSSQYTTINLGAIDPSLVSTTGSKVLLYSSGGLLYAISVVPGQHMKSSPGNTLGDSGGGTEAAVYNAQQDKVAATDSLGRPVRYLNGTRYTGGIPILLKVPLTSTSWDGDSFSDVSSSTQLDLSSVFSVPAGVQGVLMAAQVYDTGGAGNYYFACGPSSTYWYAQTIYSMSASVYCQGRPVWTPCDSNGDVWYRIEASGSSTMRVYIRIWGYMI